MRWVIQGPSCKVHAPMHPSADREPIRPSLAEQAAEDVASRALARAQQACEATHSAARADHQSAAAGEGVNVSSTQEEIAQRLDRIRQDIASSDLLLSSK